MDRVSEIEETTATALNELDTRVTALDNSIPDTVISVSKNGSAIVNPTIGGDAATYSIKQGQNEIFKIKIAKDMVISDGEVITATG